MNLFVAKLSYDTQSEDLRKVFGQYGDVSSANVVMDKITGNSRGFAFVEMDDESSANNAINGLNNSELDGRTIVVKVAEPKGDSRNSGGRGGNGGYGDRNRESSRW